MPVLNNVKSFIGENLVLVGTYKFAKKMCIRYFYNWTLKKKFYDACGYVPNLNDPKTFSEKIQWIKINCHDDLMTKCADKYVVRQYVEHKIGQKFLTKLFGVYDSPKEIKFDRLPKEFVIKSNHASGQIIICKDKCMLDWEITQQILKKWLVENYYYVTGEWVYKNINPKIIIEELLEDDIYDYKFYCFNGEPKFLYVSQGLEGDPHQAKMNYLNLDWNKTEFQRTDYKQFDVIPNRPNNFDEMIEISKSLSKDFYFVRVDLYSVSNRIIFSELTFYPNGGFAPFTPRDWEETIGGWLELPIK